jgi:hypothetical protein
MHAPLDNQTRHFNRLREALAADFGLDADDEAVIDTADGETDLAGLLVYMLRQSRERAYQVEVCAQQIRALAARMSRHAAAADKLRSLVAEAMLDTGLKRLAPGDFTASVRLSKPGPEIVDDDALPDFYFRQKVEVVPDKEAIRSEFERCAAEGAEFSIPGVAVSNGKPILTVRV